MAYKEVTVSEVRRIANALIVAAKKLRSVADEMEHAHNRKQSGDLDPKDKTHDYLKLHLQIKSVSEYTQSIKKLGTDAETLFENELDCSLTGGIPRWKSSITKGVYNASLKVRNKASAVAESMGFIPRGQGSSMTASQLSGILKLHLTQNPGLDELIEELDSIVNESVQDLADESIAKLIKQGFVKPAPKAAKKKGAK